MRNFPVLKMAGALAAVGALALGPAAFAQDDDDITIRAPYVHVSHDRSGLGDEAHVQASIPISDLDLRSDYDLDVLHQRIADSAHEVCDIAYDALRGASATTDAECVRGAIRSTRGQVRYFVERARG
ncbi:MAG: UrcA family protein [Terricaulis silvestris]